MAIVDIIVKDSFHFPPEDWGKLKNIFFKLKRRNTFSFGKKNRNLRGRHYLEQ
jgi:hypothetical protein